MTAELLTKREHDLLWKLGTVYQDIRNIISDGAQQEYDLNEAVLHIHALQRMIMAQAGARAYPDEYRLLGDSFKEK